MSSKSFTNSDLTNICHWPPKNNVSSPTILALHGFTGRGDDFAPLASSMHTNLRWWAPDITGHGDNIASRNLHDYTFQSFTRALDDLIDQVGTEVILLGYSLGGRLALRYAIEHSEKLSGLILIGATPGIIDERERNARKLSDAILAENILIQSVNTFLEYWKNTPLIKTQQKIPREIREMMDESRQKNQAWGLANNLLGMGTGVMEPLWSNLKSIYCPVLLVTGESDKKFTQIAKDMKAVIPSATHKVIPKAGHAAHLENISSFLSTLDHFTHKMPLDMCIN